MRGWKIKTVAMLSASFFLFTPCWAANAPGTAPDTDISATAPSPQEKPSRFYEYGSLRLSIPSDFDPLLITRLLPENRDGCLFSVYEKASVSAAKALKQEESGAGWLFSIGRVGEAEFQEILCRGQTGAEIFARDSSGSHYVFFHPTDVRYERETPTAMMRDQEQWSTLVHWANTSVQNDFLRDNPGLAVESYDDSEVSLYIARAAYKADGNYTISAADRETLSPGRFDASPYADRLLRNAAYAISPGRKAPEGEYVSLHFPKQDIRFDFFLQEGSENLIRQVGPADTKYLYNVIFSNSVTRTGTVMKEWYEAAAADHAMRQLGYTTDALLGSWTEKTAGRASITITKGAQMDTYDITVHWSASATETACWTMNAKPAGSNIIRYTNCRHSILFNDENATTPEEIRYENGKGSFSLNSTNELIWQDETGHAGDDVIFIRE